MAQRTPRSRAARLIPQVKFGAPIRACAALSTAPPAQITPPMRLPALASRPGFWWLAVAAWAALLFYLSSRDSIPMPPITHYDKIAHFAYFAAGSSAFFLALRFHFPSLPRAATFLLTLAFAALVGWIDEWHQSYTPGRSGNDFWDWVADSAGGLFAAALSGPFLFQQIQKRAKDRAETPLP